MIASRHCSKPGCGRPAVATLTYDYGDSTAVLGPLATVAEPHAYDLCDAHAQHLTAPKGWQVIRLQTRFDPAPPSPDDLLALVDAVREAARRPAHRPSGDPRGDSRGDLGGDSRTPGGREDAGPGGAPGASGGAWDRAGAVWDFHEEEDDEGGAHDPQATGRGARVASPDHGRREPELGPFAARVEAARSAATGEGGHGGAPAEELSPLDPDSPHARRRAHFRVVPDPDE